MPLVPVNHQPLASVPKLTHLYAFSLPLRTTMKHRAKAGRARTVLRLKRGAPIAALNTLSRSQALLAIMHHTLQSIRKVITEDTHSSHILDRVHTHMVSRQETMAIRLMVVLPLRRKARLVLPC